MPSCRRCKEPFEVTKNGRPRLYCSKACGQAARRAQRRRRSVHFSSSTAEWSTPQDFFDQLHAEFGFELDVCATAGNAKCDRYFTASDDGLAQEWRGVCWMNPPYGAGIGAWVRKAYESSLLGAIVVCLLPARTDTRWWQDCCEPHAEIRFLRGRLRFNDADPAPFPSAVVVFSYGFSNIHAVTKPVAKQAGANG